MGYSTVSTPFAESYGFRDTKLVVSRTEYEQTAELLAGRYTHTGFDTEAVLASFTLLRPDNGKWSVTENGKDDFEPASTVVYARPVQAQQAFEKKLAKATKLQAEQAVRNAQLFTSVTGFGRKGGSR